MRIKNYWTKYWEEWRLAIKRWQWQKTCLLCSGLFCIGTGILVYLNGENYAGLIPGVIGVFILFVGFFVFSDYE